MHGNRGAEQLSKRIEVGAMSRGVVALLSAGRRFDLGRRERSLERLLALGFVESERITSSIAVRRL